MMNNLVIYAPPYINQAGKVVKPRLSVVAENKFTYYKPYHYFASNLSTKQDLRLGRELSESTNNELLARARRVIFFADNSNLKPFKISPKSFSGLLDKARKGMRCDHISCWKSGWGTSFILNEPYVFDEDYTEQLDRLGLAVIELPIDVSPYCGSWNGVLGSKPGTRSFLICDARHSQELEAIVDVLISKRTVPWNSLRGISNV
jgi:hypothetical protein